MPSQFSTSSNDLPMSGSTTTLPLGEEWTLVTEEESGKLFVEASYLRPRLIMRLVHQNSMRRKKKPQTPKTLIGGRC